MNGPDASLAELRRHFLATSTRSMPLAGLIFWAALGVAAPWLAPMVRAWVTLAGAGLIVPLAMLLDKLLGRAGLRAKNAGNPVVQLFMQTIFIVALLIPFVIIAAERSGDANLVVLGLAILAGLVWIPYGWGADDKTGMVHAVARSVGCYAAYLFVPGFYQPSAICGVVVLAYLYSLIAMKKPA